MHIRRWLTTIALLAVIGGLAALGYWHREAIEGWLIPSPSAPAAEGAHDEHDHGGDNRLRLSPQAQKNLNLVLRPAHLGAHWRTLDVPGQVADRPGESDRGVTAPVTGVLTHIAAVPGSAVRPGDVLFTLRLVSEYVQNSQAQFFKTTRELEINRDEQQRLRASGDSEALFRGRLIELGYEERRLTAAMDTYRQDLLARGLTPAHLEAVAKGNFITTITVTTPGAPVPPAPPTGREARPLVYEVEELSVKLGEQVQAGQTLCHLADHALLYIEGRAFEQETPLLQKAAQNGWDVTAEFLDDTAARGPARREGLKIKFFASKLDPATRTLPFFVALPNEALEPTGPAAPPRWRFRPGQRAVLHVPIEKMDNVFVLPADAVARDGPEAYVFRANGDVLDRKPVHVLLEEGRTAVVAHDGSLAPGTVIAWNAAAPLNRALKAKLEGGGGHGHDHHGHSH
jgi:multidrug efflux pump subunit AcrA (membrane-fusion protein)